MSTLEHLELSDSGFLFDHRRGASYTLNSTGVALLRWIDEGADRDTLVLRMIEAWGIDEPRAAADLDRFLDRLQTQRVLAVPADGKAH
jgi:PqqD family protein of HPr-rel-A system